MDERTLERTFEPFFTGGRKHAFLQKPFELAQLGQLISDMLQPGRSAGRLASHS